jgi:predicted RNase H-like HicB family nuclease
MGVPMQVRVLVFENENGPGFWAKSDDLGGLVVSGETIDELRREVTSAARDLLELQGGGPRAKAVPDFRLPSSEKL